MLSSVRRSGGLRASREIRANIAENFLVPPKMFFFVVKKSEHTRLKLSTFHSVLPKMYFRNQEPHGREFPGTCAKNKMYSSIEI